MFNKLVARYGQLRRDLAYLRRATEAMVTGLFFMRGTATSGVRITVLVDRRSVWLAIQLSRAMRLLPPLSVRIVRTRPDLEATLNTLTVSDAILTPAVVVSRLLYAKHYPSFQALRGRGGLVVL